MTNEDLTTIANVGPEKADRLREAGFETVDDVKEASIEDLCVVDGIALILSSSAVALAAPGRIELFAVVGNLVFIALGVVSSVALERHAANQERKDVEPINASAE